MIRVAVKRSRTKTRKDGKAKATRYRKGRTKTIKKYPYTKKGTTNSKVTVKR